jgi:FixJ family two-component response regulator
MVQSDLPTSVYLLDDDASVRRAVSRLLHAAGIHVRAFASIDEFLGSAVELRRACVVAVALMPGDGGVDLPRRLHAGGHNIPVILMTAGDNGRLRVAAKSAGAASSFHKPVDAQALIDAIEWAVDDYGERAHPMGAVQQVSQ